MCFFRPRGCKIWQDGDEDLFFFQAKPGNQTSRVPKNDDIAVKEPGGGAGPATRVCGVWGHFCRSSSLPGDRYCLLGGCMAILCCLDAVQRP